MALQGFTVRGSSVFSDMVGVCWIAGCPAFFGLRSLSLGNLRRMEQKRWGPTVPSVKKKCHFLVVGCYLE